jgi:hypothetical protein
MSNQSKDKLVDPPAYKLEDIFSMSDLTPKQEKAFVERQAKEKNDLIKALENKNKLKGSKPKQEYKNIGMMGGGYIEKEMIKKKHGGKIIYKMSGGRVVDAGYE